MYENSVTWYRALSHTPLCDRRFVGHQHYPWCELFSHQHYAASENYSDFLPTPRVSAPSEHSWCWLQPRHCFSSASRPALERMVGFRKEKSHKSDVSLRAGNSGFMITSDCAIPSTLSSAWAVFASFDNPKKGIPLRLSITTVTLTSWLILRTVLIH